jgi:phosphoglycerate dehydrogenase-like enzyme
VTQPAARGAVRRLVFNMRDERPAWAPPAQVVPQLRAALGADWELIEVDAPASGRGDGGGVHAAAIEAAAAAVRGAEVYFGLGLPHAILAVALEPPSHLRWVHSGSAGVASLLHPELVESDVVLTNSAGIYAEPMAETVLGMILHFARGLDLAMRAQQRREWGASHFDAGDSGVREIAGATLGIIGYGGIGRAVAQRAHALGMRVLAMRAGRTPDAAMRADDSGTGDDSDGAVDTGTADTAVVTSAADVVVITGGDALERVLRASDFLVVAVPSTPRTRGMIGARELALLPTGAVLINVARGDVVDEHALAEALAARRLRGAGLDVFTAEPLPAESPLWQLDNVLITPHVSAVSPRYWERQLALLLDNLRRYQAGEPLRNVVDKRAGY